MAILIFCLNFIFQIYALLILLRAILSYFPHDRYQPLMYLLYQATDPPLKWVRRFIPSGNYGIDFSPFVVLIIVWVLQQILIQLLTLLI